MMMGNSLERNQTSLAYRSLSILLLCAVVFTPLGLNSDSWAYQDAAKTPPTGEAPACNPGPPQVKLQLQLQLRLPLVMQPVVAMLLQQLQQRQQKASCPG